LDKFRDEFGLAGGGSGAGPSEISAFGRCARSGCLYALWSRQECAMPVMVPGLVAVLAVGRPDR
jgi:hypothetical protein